MKQHAEANKAKALDSKQLAKEYEPYKIRKRAFEAVRGGLEMSIRNKIGLGMIALFILVMIVGNFLDGFWHGVTFISVVAWIVIALELSSSRR
ncbi:hypothetical protein T1I15_10300 [Lactiplantibacillus plantarum]|nr:hypothetical protein T1I15_10300 [Lactiplantibacillus plantarum]